MSKHNFAVIVSFVFAVVSFAGCQKQGSANETLQHATETRAESAAPESTPGSTQEVPATQAIVDLPAPPPPPLRNMISDAGLRRVLNHIENGDVAGNTPEVQLFLEQASHKPDIALARIKHALDSTPAHDTMARVYIFAAMAEIAHALNDIDTKKVDEYLTNALPLIKRQLSAPLYVALPKQGYSQDEIRQFSQNDLFFYENGIVYANTYRAQHMAVAVLGEAATPYTLGVLAEIANNQAVDNRIRQVAGMGVRQVRK